jgi:hypothetical protein
MKFSKLGTFALGVMITAVSLGAVTYVNAAGNATIKVCANKTTGAMRYLSKGSCKKSEKALTWNQMGPQGLSGNNGADGAKGETGPKGETGATPDVATFAKKTEVIGKTFTSATIPSTPIPSDNSVLVPGPSTEIVSASELLGMSSRSYTRRYEIPLNWLGRIEGRCPADAPVPLTHGVYALDATGKKFGDDGWPPYGWYSLGSRASISFEGPPGNGQIGNPLMTLFVTQVCGPITTLVAG